MRKSRQPTEPLPWYRERTYKGNLTEAEKRQLDAFRMQDKHPAADWNELPEEVQSYISRIEMDVYDRKQSTLAVTTIACSAAGLLLGYSAYMGYVDSSAWKYAIAAILTVAPWFFYRRQWNKNAEEFLPSDNPGRPTEEGIRQEWEMNYLAHIRRPGSE